MLVKRYSQYGIGLKTLDNFGECLTEVLKIRMDYPAAAKLHLEATVAFLLYSYILAETTSYRLAVTRVIKKLRHGNLEIVTKFDKGEITNIPSSLFYPSKVDSGIVVGIELANTLLIPQLSNTLGEL